MKITGKMCHVNEPSEVMKQIDQPVGSNYSTDNSDQQALTGFRNSITSSNLTHDICHMSLLALLPIIAVSLI